LYWGVPWVSMCTSYYNLLVMMYLGPFFKLETSFKGIINPNVVDKASGNVLEYLG